MMKILQTFTPDVGVYSIDKAFLYLSPLPSLSVQHLRKESTTPIGIPFTIGALRRQIHLKLNLYLRQAASYMDNRTRSCTQIKKP